ncbi:MAG: exodeoxyribonuclease III, partial [Betaproteobacteria bacterium]
EQASTDCMGVHEIKAQHEDGSGVFVAVAGMRAHLHHAQTPGYSGVGLYARVQPSDVIIGFDGGEFDDEGRYVEYRWDKPGRKFSVLSVYFPSGSSGEDRQAAKFRFREVMGEHLKKLPKTREFILVGDVNIAHREIDLKNWKGNLKNSGFLPEERQWMTTLLEQGRGGGGLVDVYRSLHPEVGEEAYTWWSNRGQAYAKNVGWRIDYHLATPGVAATARAASVYKAQRFSDHAPLTVDYGLTL